MATALTNLCLLSDSYKLTHWRQYPPGTETVYSYMEARGGAYSATVFFGLQYVLKKYLRWPVRVGDVLEANTLATEHFGNADLFNYDGWMHIVRDHGGWLPLRIKALPEGSVVPIGTPLITVENTCPQCFWLTNYMETLLVQTWYPTTVATRSRDCKRIIGGYLGRTGDPATLDYKLHDFGFRGVSSVESAGIGGCAHLVNFHGTDTLPALLVARDVYGATTCAGHSIPASEHSTITSWGKQAEVCAFENMLGQYPTGLVACVSDSYDIWHACAELWGGTLRANVLNRDGVVVVRPDSGEPVVVVPEVVKTLGKAFGFTTNAKGFKVLDPHVRVIQGDGVNPESINEILFAMETAGLSADNVAFGMGSALLQQLHRDTCKMAFKCSAINKNGHWMPVAKDPITDHGKKSKAGRFEVYKDPKWETNVWASDNLPDGMLNQLQTVFENGVITKEWTLSEIRARAAT